MYISEAFIQTRIKQERERGEKVNVHKVGTGFTLDDVVNDRVPAKWSSPEGIKYLMQR